MKLLWSIELGQAQRLAQRGDGNTLISLGLGATHPRGRQRRFGIVELNRNGQALLETVPRQGNALGCQLGRRLGDREAFPGGVQVEPGLFDFRSTASRSLRASSRAVSRFARAWLTLPRVKWPSHKLHCAITPAV